VTFNATVAQFHADREHAVAGLREQLRACAAGACAGRPDWSSLVVDGPREVAGVSGRPLYVWMATVETSLGYPVD
jgi:hypothetical protein